MRQTYGPRRPGQRPFVNRLSGCALLAQLSTHPIAIGNVQLLQLFEPQQQRQRLRRIMPIAYKPGGALALACDMSLAHRHVPSACAKCCLTMSRSVDEDFTAWGRRAVTFGGAAIEWKDGIVLSFLQAGARASLSHRRPRGGSLPVIGHRALQ